MRREVYGRVFVDIFAQAYAYGPICPNYDIRADADGMRNITAGYASHR